MARALIGTSGWHYDSWRGPFYPAGLPIKSQLQYYASQFHTAELNGVFYRTPTPEAVNSWKKQTGKDFVFTWKASKFITHWKRLSSSSVNSLELMEDRLSLMGHKVGLVLFQLPPNFQADAERLSGFLRILSSKRRYSFEFRPAGIRCRSCASSRSRLRGSEPQTLSISEVTGQAGDIRGTIP
jgi:uncharacterized protein YecE (DUF72 family)